MALWKNSLSSAINLLGWVLFGGAVLLLVVPVLASGEVSPAFSKVVPAGVLIALAGQLFSQGKTFKDAEEKWTCNLDFPEWDQAFPANRLLASASLDRLRHNAYCLVLDGLSYRAPKQTPSTVKSIPQKPAKSPSA